MTSPESIDDSLRWPRRLATVLGIVTLVLITVGGIVTTYRAGMAVEDWPGTFGFNMFLYPMERWVFGPFNLRVEHGHRLLGSLAGMVAIALVISTLGRGVPSSVRWAAFGLLGLVIAQGVLGGLRVKADARKFALVHGMLGPTFFAFAISFAVICSKSWRACVERVNDETRLSSDSQRARSSYLVAAVALVALAWGQLTLGAHLRHPLDDSSPRSFQAFVVFHLAVAVALVVQSWNVWRASTRLTDTFAAKWNPRVWGLAGFGLVSFQVFLGMSTWVAKYGFPAALDVFPWAAAYVVTAKDALPATIVTSHVVVGALILANAAGSVAWGWGLVGPTKKAVAADEPKRTAETTHIAAPRTLEAVA